MHKLWDFTVYLYCNLQKIKKFIFKGLIYVTHAYYTHTPIISHMLLCLTTNSDNFVDSTLKSIS